MPETFSEFIDRTFREREGYTGDGRGGDGLLPSGDRSTAVKPIDKRGLREAFHKVAPYHPFSSYAEAATDPKLEPVDRVEWRAGNRMIRALRNAGGPILGGGWMPEGSLRPEHFNGDIAALRAYAGSNSIVIGGPSVTGSVYGNDHLGTNDGNSVVIGSIPTPNLSHEPVIRVERVSGAVYDPDKLSVYTPMAEWTQRITGGGSHHVIGTFYGYTNGHAREIIGVHGRAEVQSGGQSDGIFGLWGFAAARPGATVGSVAGAELNVANQIADQGWQASLHGSTTRSVGLIINNDGTTTNSKAATAGVWLGRNTGGAGRGEIGSWHTGFLFDRNAITRTDENGNNEAIRIRGGEGSTYQYGGIAFGDTGTDMSSKVMSYGLKSVDIEFADDALIWAKPGHRIRWGTDKANARYVGLSPDSQFLYLGGNNAATMEVYPVFPLRGGAPALVSNRLFTFIYVNDTTVQFRMRGADGVTRIHNMTFTAA